VVASYLGWTLDAFDFFLLVFVLKDIAAEFGTDVKTVSVAIVLTLAARPLGALLFVAADRYGRRPTLMVDIVCYSAIEFASGFAPSLTALLVLRTLYGVAMGGEWGVGASLTMESIPPKTRGIVSGILQAGYPSGYLIASVVYGLLFSVIGWRGMFMVGALPALLVLYIRSTVEESPAFAARAGHASTQSLWRVIRNNIGLFIFSIVLMTAFNFFSHGTQDLYPTFLQVQRHLTPHEVGAIVIYNIGAILGGIGFGVLSEHIGRRRAIVIAALLALPIIPLWAYASNVVLLAVGAFLMQIAVQGAWGIIPAHLNELSPEEVRGTFPRLHLSAGQSACLRQRHAAGRARAGLWRRLRLCACCCCCCRRDCCCCSRRLWPGSAWCQVRRLRPPPSRVGRTKVPHERYTIRVRAGASAVPEGVTDLDMKLEPGRNVWRTAKAARAAMLVDAAAYFGAVRRAMIAAERSIVIAGWDIHSQTLLVGNRADPDDGYPLQFADFLGALVKKKPDLDISLLLWDFSVLYATERDLFPTLTLRWNVPSQIKLCLDNCVPLGSSQHQKLVVIDDKVAFSGGIDMTIRRWDTSAHKLDEPRRVDPNGRPYRPFHDVQLMVDSEAARALGDLVRARWESAACEMLQPVDCEGDPWPRNIEPDFSNVEVGIARTQPQYEREEQRCEVEQLFFDCIDAAERSIYIENQFLTAPRIAQRLAQRLKNRPNLEVLIVTLDTHESWLEAHSMLIGRIRFTRTLQEAARERVLVMHPQVTEGERGAAVMVHAKVMIVDDKILRIGSANLNNRSMGADTECDLIIVAGNEDERRRIAHARARLLGDHCGTSPEDAADALEKAGGSLLAVARELKHGGHSMQPITDDPKAASELFTVLENVADPERPVGAEEFVAKMFGGYVPTRHIGVILKVIVGGLIVVAIALLWQFTPLASPKAVKSAFSSIAGSPAAPFIMVGSFVAGGFVMFPVTVLIGATAAVFGPLLGFTYAASGAIASALATYAVGRAVGKKTLRNLLGPRLNRLRRQVARRGIITVAAVRLVPVAPFTVVNLVAGASGIPLIDYVAGTLLGMLPGLIMISAVGYQLAQMMTSPSGSDLAILAGIVAAWIALSFGVQAAVSRYWSTNR
jgi:phosphatidylserine/phosphatidylglycerophosphate/cardiolipin synthase-like enzyme/uncharacterized membrane protein YdjX (TVP38/TMEM64 family)/MFS family permease